LDPSTSTARNGGPADPIGSYRDACTPGRSCAMDEMHEPGSAPRAPPSREMQNAAPNDERALSIWPSRPPVSAWGLPAASPTRSSDVRDDQPPPYSPLAEKPRRPRGRRALALRAGGDDHAVLRAPERDVEQPTRCSSIAATTSPNSIAWLTASAAPRRPAELWSKTWKANRLSLTKRLLADPRVDRVSANGLVAGAER
jgi:hypothetical protein